MRLEVLNEYNVFCAELLEDINVLFIDENAEISLLRKVFIQILIINYYEFQIQTKKVGFIKSLLHYDISINFKNYKFNLFCFNTELMISCVENERKFNKDIDIFMDYINLQDKQNGTCDFNVFDLNWENESYCRITQFF